MLKCSIQIFNLTKLNKRLGLKNNELIFENYFSDCIKKLNSNTQVYSTTINLVVLDWFPDVIFTK